MTIIANFVLIKIKFSQICWFSLLLFFNCVYYTYVKILMSLIFFSYFVTCFYYAVSLSSTTGKMKIKENFVKFFLDHYMKLIFQFKKSFICN